MTVDCIATTSIKGDAESDNNFSLIVVLSDYPLLWQMYTQLCTIKHYLKLLEICISFNKRFGFFLNICMNKSFSINVYANQNGPRREKTCLQRYANNKSADQPAHSRSPISAFIIRVLESTISKLDISKISIF